ncbi:hypothetical protein [Arthrobacter rhombi]|uniref:hypothetical protein n=1 Tax=Arthrobacter rhombi TaxID=71253 RepID=UPI003FD12988
MNMSRGRAVGSAFSAKEKTVLDLLCSGDHPYRELAREQLRVASWGGYQLDECDCFLISVPKLPKAARIRHGGGPFSTLDVSRAGEGLGQLDLWVVDGYLHSVDYMTYDDHEMLPDLEDETLEPLY